MNNSPKINGLVISAGLSTRMQDLKPLMDYEGKPFLAGILLKLSLICDTILVVTGFESHNVMEAIQNFLGRQIHNINYKVDWCFNPDYKKGMFSSLQAGIRDLKNGEWTLYHFVDQPGLPEDFYMDFRNQLDNGYDWIQPTYLTKTGHPILLSRKMIELILKANPTHSLRELKKNKNIQKTYWDCNYPQILQDFNSQEQLLLHKKNNK